MSASAFVGRVGGLAVALGVGAVLGGLGLGTASASPSDTSSATDSASSASSRPDAAEGARGARSTPGLAVSARARGVKAAMQPVTSPAATLKSSGSDAVPVTAAATAQAPSPFQVGSGRVRILLPTLVAQPISLAQASFSAPAAVATQAVGETTEPVAVAAALPAATTGLVEPAVSLQPGSDPSGPAESPLSWGVLAAARRDSATAAAVASAEAVNPISAFFFNQTPSLTWTANPGQGSNGVVTGILTATDGDSSPLTYSVSSAPSHGSVVIGPGGSYTYTPAAEFLPTGTTDSFGVTVSDSSTGFHIHGLGGLLNLLTFGLLGSNGHTAETTVAVTVAPAWTTTTVEVGQRPLGIAVSLVDGRVYVANYDDNNISVIDAATNTVTKIIALTQIPGCLDCGPGSLAVTPNGSQLYAIDGGSVPLSGVDSAYIYRTTVSAINTAINAISSVELGSNSGSIAVVASPDGQAVYVGFPGWPSPIPVINTTTNQLTGRLNSPTGSMALAVSPDSQRLYAMYGRDVWTTAVSANQPGNLYTASRSFLNGMALSPDGRTLYVSESNGVKVIDSATGDVRETVNLPGQVNTSTDGFGTYSTVAVSPDGTRLYVLNPSGGTMYVVDTVSSSVVSVVPVGATPYAVAVSRDGKSIYVTNQSANTLTVISNLT